MIKKIFLLLVLPALMFAQQEPPQNTQNVELPEFVITGVERVSLPAVNKPKADIVPTLSNEFFRPSYSPEELPIAELSNPVRKDITFVNEAAKYNGRLEVAAGLYTIPSGELAYGNSFDNGLFSAKLWGRNIRSYFEDNSGYNNIGVDLKTDFFNSYNSGFLPGTKFTIGGNFARDSYKFFAASDPTVQRERNLGNFALGLNNLMKNTLKYGINLNESMLYVKDADISENIFTAKGYLETGFKGVLIGVNAGYKNQNLKTTLNNYRDFFEGSGYVKFRPSDNLHFAFGLYYATVKGDHSFFPTGSVTLKLSDNMTLLGEMSPYSELVTVTDLIYQNPYLNLSKDLGIFIRRSGGIGLWTLDLGNSANIFVDTKFNMKGALKYEFNKYFEIDGGFRFVEYNNYPYFVPGDLAKGRFDVYTAPAKKFTGFMNFLFHPGPYGMFYGDIQIEHFYDSNNNSIPYNPGIRTSFSYEYNFDFGLKTQSRFSFNSAAWADVPNTIKMNPYLNLGIRLGYELKPNFDLFTEFTNLLNRNNYIWYGYKEKPADIIFGIDYRF